MAPFQVVFEQEKKKSHRDRSGVKGAGEPQECFFCQKIHWWRLPCDTGRCRGAASRCVQCLVAHVPPFSWFLEGLSDKKFDWEFVLVAQIPCGRSPDCQKNKWASIWFWIYSFSLSCDLESLLCATDNANEEFWLPLKAVQKIKTHPSVWSSAQSWGSLEPSRCTLFSCPNPVLKFDWR